MDAEPSARAVARGPGLATRPTSSASRWPRRASRHLPLTACRLGLQRRHRNVAAFSETEHPESRRRVESLHFLLEQLDRLIDKLAGSLLRCPPIEGGVAWSRAR